MWKAIDKFGVFFGNFFTALKYAAFDFDVTLQRTRTKRQRIVIWIIIAVVVVTACYLLLFFLGQLVRNIVNNRMIKLRDTPQ